LWLPPPRSAIGTVTAGQKTLDWGDSCPIIGPFLCDHFCEEKEVIMRSERIAFPVSEVCVRDIPET
jgi:hypothetical protein